MGDSNDYRRMTESDVIERLNQRLADLEAHIRALLGLLDGGDYYNDRVCEAARAAVPVEKSSTGSEKGGD